MSGSHVYSIYLHKHFQPPMQELLKLRDMLHGLSITTTTLTRPPTATSQRNGGQLKRLSKSLAVVPCLTAVFRLVLDS